MTYSRPFVFVKGDKRNQNHLCLIKNKLEIYFAIFIENTSYIWIRNKNRIPFNTIMLNYRYWNLKFLLKQNFIYGYATEFTIYLFITQCHLGNKVEIQVKDNNKDQTYPAILMGKSYKFLETEQQL